MGKNRKLKRDFRDGATYTRTCKVCGQSWAVSPSVAHTPQPKIGVLHGTSIVAGGLKGAFVAKMLQDQNAALAAVPGSACPKCGQCKFRERRVEPPKPASLISKAKTATTAKGADLARQGLDAAKKKAKEKYQQRREQKDQS